MTAMAVLGLQTVSAMETVTALNHGDKCMTVTAIVGLQTVCQPWKIVYDSYSYSGTSDCVSAMENV